MAVTFVGGCGTVAAGTTGNFQPAIGETWAIAVGTVFHGGGTQAILELWDATNSAALPLFGATIDDISLGGFYPKLSGNSGPQGVVGRLMFTSNTAYLRLNGSAANIGTQYVATALKVQDVFVAVSGAKSLAQNATVNVQPSGSDTLVLHGLIIPNGPSGSFLEAYITNGTTAIRFATVNGGVSNSPVWGGAYFTNTNYLQLKQVNAATTVLGWNAVTTPNTNLVARNGIGAIGANITVTVQPSAGDYWKLGLLAFDGTMAVGADPSIQFFDTVNTFSNQNQAALCEAKGLPFILSNTLYVKFKNDATPRNYAYSAVNFTLS